MIENFYGIMCLAWHEDEEGYVELISPTAEKIYLNWKLRLIWKTLAENKYKSRCVERLLQNLSQEEVDDGLNYLIENKLVKEYRKEFIFDDLFAQEKGTKKWMFY